MALHLKDIILATELEKSEAPFADFENGKADVIAVIEIEKEGEETLTRHYVASFFTYKNIETIRMRNRNQGKFLYGKYFWAEGMVLIDNLLLESIRQVTLNLMAEGDFLTVFQPLQVQEI